MDIAQIVGAIAFMAVMNRLAGLKDWSLPGRSLFYVTPGVILAGYVATDSWAMGVMFGLGFVFWRLFSWGYLITLGYYTPDRQPSVLEMTLLRTTHGEYFSALVLRMCFVLPIMVWLAFTSANPVYAVATIPLAFALSGAYALAWRVSPSNPIHIAEYICGAIWGFLMVTAS